MLMLAGQSAIMIFLNINSFALVCMKLLHTAKEKICNLGSHVLVIDKKNDIKKLWQRNGTKCLTGLV